MQDISKDTAAVLTNVRVVAVRMIRCKVDMRPLCIAAVAHCKLSKTDEPSVASAFALNICSVRKADARQVGLNDSFEPTLTDAARRPNDSNAQKADFAKSWVQIVIEVYFLRTLGLSIADWGLETRTTDSV
ncbi:hypothetical protein [Ruegeria profundi]|uniref:hypothetical protein n=1 Tax=Ruegeria profundi TaxID=1685378 RepID=UPI003C7E1668